MNDYIIPIPDEKTMQEIFKKYPVTQTNYIQNTWNVNCIFGYVNLLYTATFSHYNLLASTCNAGNSIDLKNYYLQHLLRDCWNRKFQNNPTFKDNINGLFDVFDYNANLHNNNIWDIHITELIVNTTVTFNNKQYTIPHKFI